MKGAPRARGGVGKSHRFAVREDPGLLRGAVVAEGARRTERSIVVTLRAGEVGHAFPTGDLFRRLEVRAVAEGGGEGEGGGEERGAIRAPAVVLERVFRVQGDAQGVSSRVQVRDDRVPASGEPRGVVVVFPEVIAGRAVRWEVVYRRMGATLAASFGVDLASDEVVVATGALPAAVPGTAGERENVERPGEEP